MCPDPSPRWLGADGSPLLCAEKRKILDQNLEEFEGMVRDFLDDAALMGCDVGRVRTVLQHALESLQSRYPTRTPDDG